MIPPRLAYALMFAGCVAVWGVLIAVAINVAALTLADIATSRSHPEWLQIEGVSR